MPGENEKLGRPREAFALLGHDLRLEILLALLDRWRAAHTEPQRYSELMRAVDLQDSGKFNYHLGKLRGAYLRKTEDGYVPTASATALYRAVLANRPTEPAARSELDSDAACPDCDEPLVAAYEGDFLTLRCPACDRVVGDFTYPFPKNGLDERTDEEVVRAAYQRARSQVGLARRGQCPDCAGTTTVAIRRDLLGRDDEHDVEITCDTCTWVVAVDFLLPLLSDARVAAALVDLGVPVETTFSWELPEPTVTVASADPLELELRIESDGGTATVVVDGDLDVRSVTTDDGCDDGRDAGRASR